MRCEAIRKAVIALAVAAQACFTQTALATETGGNVPVNAGSYIQALLALVLIVAILGATAWFARKLSGGKGFGQGGMKVLGGIALGPKERIVLVEVADQWLVIGLVPGQIRTLHRMPRQTLPPDGSSIDTIGNKPFAQWLNSVVSRPHD